MNLTHKLLLSYLSVVAVTGGTLVVAADRALRSRLTEQATHELEREALLLGAAATGLSPESLSARVHELGRTTGRRLTVVDEAGRVVADSDFPPDQLAGLENHRRRPEFLAAFEGGVGVDLRHSASTGRDELKVAVPWGRGAVRVSSPLAQVDALVRRAQGAVLLGALAAAGVAVLLAFGFSRGVARPLVRLRDAAQAIARGEHPAVDVRGRDEVGDLARVLHTVDDNLASRVRQLEQERSETAALIASMVEGVVACDARGAVTTINPAARQLLGLAEHGAAPPVHELLRHRVAHEAVEAILGGAAVAGIEVAHDTRTLLVSGQALPEGGAVLVLHDVTTLKRLEAVRRDFVANVSHELKTPLTVLRGYAETLARDDPPADLRTQFLATILGNAHRMQRLIDDLLDLSRIESQAWTPAPANVALGPLATEVWNTVGAAAAGSGVAFAVELPPGAEQVHADPEAVRQILTNVLENAARYTPPGGRIAVTAQRDAGAMVRVAVSDTGTGIPSEHLPRLFERFYRVDPHRSREAGGTGLGLAIVKHLVEAHGGRVEAESRLGVGAGTTIRWTLPAPPSS